MEQRGVDLQRGGCSTRTLSTLGGVRMLLAIRRVIVRDASAADGTWNTSVVRAGVDAAAPAHARTILAPMRKPANSLH